MGLFETIKLKKAAKKVGLTYEQYLQYLLMASAKGYSLEDYRMYLTALENGYSLDEYRLHLNAVAVNMTDEQYREFTTDFSMLQPEQFLHFYRARSEGLNLNDYDEYLEKYQDLMSAAQYADYIKLCKGSISIKEYTIYLQEHPQSSMAALEIFIATKKAHKLNMTLLQFRDYTVNYSELFSAEQYLMFCDALNVGLSQEQFIEYWDDYREQYSLERFFQYCQARKDGLSLEQYDEWKTHYSTLSAARYRNLLEARKQNMPLETYEELKCARQLGLTVEQYQEKKLADSLGIQVKNLPFYRACRENQENGINFAIVASWEEIRIANKLRVKKVIMVAEQFKTIPYRAFEGCDAFEEIILPWGIQEIGEQAFYNCSALEMIDIPGSVSTIPKGIFDGCSALRAIELLSGIETVDITGWSDLPSLKSVVSASSIKDFLIQDSLEKTYTYEDTSDYLFGLQITAANDKQQTARTVILKKDYSHIWLTVKLTDFINAENIVIHCKYVDKIELENCPNVKTIIVDGCIKRYVDCYKNGNIKKISTYTNGIDIPNNQQNLKFFLVRDHLERIGGGSNCPELNWVHLPAGTQTVKIDAPSLIALSTSAKDVPKSILTIFRNPKNTLTSTVAPMRVRCKYANKITEFIHYITETKLPDEIKKADEIEIMEGMTEIPQSLFMDCMMAVVKLPASLKAIEKDAFSGCKNLKIVYLKNCPNYIGSKAFEKCPIEIVYGIDPITARVKLGVYSISLCGVRELDFSAIKSVIPPKCFQGSDAEEIVVPKRVKEIGALAFANSKKLTRIVFKGCPEIIAPDAFKGCTQVEEIIWGACTHFGIAGKTGFPKIRRFSIPEGVTEIPDNCFTNWGIQDVVIPQSVVFIGKNAFSGCPISTINGESGILRLTENCQMAPNAFSKCSFRTIVFDVSQPDKFIEIAESVGATEIIIRDTVGIDSFNRILSIPNLTSISCIKTDEPILASTDELGEIPVTLRFLELPRSVGKLDFIIFNGCEELIALTIPESVERVLFEAKLSDMKLQEITVPTDMYYVILKERINPDTQVTLLGEGHPEKYEVTAIGEDAHLPELDEKDRLLIQKLIIPEQCASIAESAFENLVNLRSVDIRASIQSVGAKAFCGCAHLEQIVLPDSVDSIGEAAFLGCTSLAQVQLPQALTKIESEVFSKCAKLRNIDLPTTITMIGESAFEGCEWLDTLAIPDQLHELGAFAFTGSGLKTAHIPDGIKRLHTGVFKDCAQLSTVTGMQNVGYVDEDAFSCSAVEDLIFSEEIFAIDDAFKMCDMLQRIFIPVNIAKFCVDLSNCDALEHLYLPQQIDEFSCVTTTNNKITAHARRGSAWRKQLNVKTVDYIKNAEYDEFIRIELEKAGLQRCGIAQCESPIVRAAESNRKRGTGNVVHRRASWNTKSHTATAEEQFASGPSTVDELLGKLQSSKEHIPYVVESVACNFVSISVQTVPDANVYASDETKTINNNIFTISLKHRERPFSSEFYVVLIDNQGLPASDIKKVKMVQEHCETISIQLQLNAGTINGEYYLVTASQAYITDSVLSADKCLVDIAFAMDVDFDF